MMPETKLKRYCKNLKIAGSDPFAEELLRKEHKEISELAKNIDTADILHGYLQADLNLIKDAFSSIGKLEALR